MHGVCRGRRGRSPHRLRGGCCAGAAEEAQRTGVDRRTGRRQATVPAWKAPFPRTSTRIRGPHTAGSSGSKKHSRRRRGASRPQWRPFVFDALSTPGSAGGVLWRQSPPCRRQHYPMHRAACQPLCIFVRHRPLEGLRRVESAQSGWRRRIVDHWTLRLQGDRRGRWTSSSQLWVGRHLRRRRWALSGR